MCLPINFSGNFQCITIQCDISYNVFFFFLVGVVLWVTAPEWVAGSTG